VRSARCQRPRNGPRSLATGPAVGWSPPGGGGTSLRLAWSGRATRGWIGPGWSATREATRRERAARARRGLIQPLIGGDVRLWSPTVCGGGRERRPGAQLRRRRGLSSCARLDPPSIPSPPHAGIVAPTGTVRRRRLSALPSAALAPSRRSRCPRPPRRVGVLPERSMSGPFPAEIRAVPLPSPLPPLPPFLLPLASLFVFFLLVGRSFPSAPQSEDL
jgi:hypothetical protein